MVPSENAFDTPEMLTRGKELSAVVRNKQGAGPDKTRWRAGFGPQVLCLPPALYRVIVRFKVC